MFEFHQRWRIVVDKDMSKCGYIFPLRICENVGVVCQGVRKWVVLLRVIMFEFCQRWQILMVCKHGCGFPLRMCVDDGIVCLGEMRRWGIENANIGEIGVMRE